LNEIHSAFIVDKEDRLEVFRSNDTKRSRNAIRITSTRLKGNLIVQEIERKLKGIHRIKLPLKALMPASKQDEQSNFNTWVKAHFDESMMAELARLTGTDIRKTPRGSVRSNRNTPLIQAFAKFRSWTSLPLTRVKAQISPQRQTQQGG